MKVSIVIPTCNHCSDLLKPCIESILKYTNMLDVEIVVVANGCTDETPQYLKDRPVKLIWFNESIGYTRATNEGIKAADGEYVILLNNDTVLLEQPPNQWLDVLLEPFKDDRVGITGPMRIKFGPLQRDFLIFFCVCTKRTLLNQFGLLDEIFSPGYGEDVDFCFKLQDAGYKIHQVCEAGAHFDSSPLGNSKLMIGAFPIWHKGNETFKGLPGDVERIARSDQILIDRYKPQTPASRPTVYNCLSFNNELDLLEMRFIELYNVVDKFVISEGNKTFGGKPKPYYFRDNIERFRKYMPKVIHLTVDTWPDFSPWTMEHYQRDCMMGALTQCKDDDIIVITDADELPSARAIKNYRPENGIQDLEMDLYYYNFNTRWKHKWKQPKIAPYGALKKSNFWDVIYGPASSAIPNGGKHLSYFGDVQTVIKKLEDGAHQELNTDKLKDPDRIRKIIENGIDVLERPEEEYAKVHPQVKFNLGCGGDCKTGFFNVDLQSPYADIYWDLSHDWKFSQDGFADHVYASNIFEHLPDKTHTMNELYRILRVGGTAELIIPSTDGRGAWQDPTHVSFWNANSWQYWCSNVNAGLTAYNRDCGFKGDFKLLSLDQQEMPDKVIMTRVVLEKV